MGYFLVFGIVMPTESANFHVVATDIFSHLGVDMKAGCSIFDHLWIELG